MKTWNCAGASLIGHAHLVEAMPNQDSWKAIDNIHGSGIVVCDGLGSKPHSKIGSESLCTAVSFVLNQKDNFEISHDALVQKIQSMWLQIIEPLKAEQCSTTCLFVFHHFSLDKVFLSMLGDGMAIVTKSNQQVFCYSENKSEDFSNVTQALGELTKTSDWRHDSFPAEEIHSLILMTDGLSECIENMEYFVQKFLGNHVGKSKASLRRRIRWLLEDWKKERNSDDKTIACMLPAGGGI